MRGFSAVRTEKLESVQRFAARIVTNNWSGSHSELLSKVNWPSLSTRRRKRKVALYYRIVKNLSIIDSSFFTPHPCPHLRHAHFLPLYYLPRCTLSHLSSFSVSVIPIWNCLPPEFFSVFLPTFKHLLKLLPVI